MTRPFEAYVGDRSGAAAVEFALAVLPLMVTILSVVQLGRYAWTVQAVESVATAAARCIGLRSASCAASSAPSVSLTQAYAVGVASKWHLTLQSSQVTVATATTCGGTSGMSQVTVASTFAADVLVPALAAVPISATACFPNVS